MKPIYFIADLHLSETHPELTALFNDFMQNKAQEAQAVYILGDLFDFWIGDDETSSLISQVKQSIKNLTEKGIACYFIHCVDLYGVKTLICHGDTLCIDDVKYQQFRRKVHQKWRQRLFLCLPLKVRLKIAEKIRAKSKQDKQYKPLDIMDVNLAFTAQTVKEFGVKWLIHGHTHREAIHQEKGYTRIVLGDWRKDYASILEVTENGYRFI